MRVELTQKELQLNKKQLCDNLSILSLDCLLLLLEGELGL